MEVTMGKQGRIVLPKAVREALALEEGSRLTVEVSGSHIELAPVEVGQAHWRQGILVIEGSKTDRVDYNKVLDDVRMRKL